MQNAFYNLAGDGKAGFIDVRDIASVATKILLSEGPSLNQYEINHLILRDQKRFLSVRLQTLFQMWLVGKYHT